MQRVELNSNRHGMTNNNTNKKGGLGDGSVDNGGEGGSNLLDHSDLVGTELLEGLSEDVDKIIEEDYSETSSDESSFSEFEEALEDVIRQCREGDDGRGGGQNKFAVGAGVIDGGRNASFYKRLRQMCDADDKRSPRWVRKGERARGKEDEEDEDYQQHHNDDNADEENEDEEQDTAGGGNITGGVGGGEEKKKKKKTNANNKKKKSQTRRKSSGSGSSSSRERRRKARLAAMARRKKKNPKKMTIDSQSATSRFKHRRAKYAPKLHPAQPSSQDEAYVLKCVEKQLYPEPLAGVNANATKLRLANYSLGDE